MRAFKSDHVLEAARRALQIEIVPIHLDLAVALDGFDPVRAARVRSVRTRVIRGSELTVNFTLAVIAKGTWRQGGFLPDWKKPSIILPFGIMQLYAGLSCTTVHHRETEEGIFWSVFRTFRACSSSVYLDSFGHIG